METATIQASSLVVQLHESDGIGKAMPRLESYFANSTTWPLSRHPRWLNVLRRGLKHVPYCLEALEGDRTRGVLPLALVRSFLFGRFLVSLPYLNVGGVVADDSDTTTQLVDRAVDLADKLDVRYLELRHEKPIEHDKLNHSMTHKVHMRLELPDRSEPLWKSLDPKVRNQVRKGQKNELAVAWGTHDLLRDFYDVFSENMRDLGTPVYSRMLFKSILDEFPDMAEFCIVRLATGQPIAAALLLHGRGVTEVPSASSLRPFNSTCANMLMYWSLLERAIERKQNTFDFGRSSEDSNTYRFKKQWGAAPAPAHWQFCTRHGTPGEMRPDDPRYQRRIAMWRRLPLGLTRLIGPSIVRGIP
jgi:serine/alanine adding enzyme